MTSRTGSGKSWTAMLLIAVMALVAVSALGCGDDDDDTGGSGDSGGSGETVKVGNITSVAGIGGVFAGYQAGVKAFFDYYNSQGGIDGTKVELITVDDAADPGKASAGARKLVTQDDVLAIVGQASLADAATAKYFNAQGIPVVGGWATSSAWHKPNTNMFVNIEGPNLPYCGLWPLDFAAEFGGIDSIAFIAQDFPTATQDADCRAAAAKRSGLGVAGKRIDVALTAADYRPAMEQAISTGADGIFFSTGSDGQLKGIQAGEQLGFKGMYITTQPSGLEKPLAPLALDDRVLTGAFSLLPSDPDGINEELAAFKKGMEQFQPKYATEITAVSGWAAGRMFADALKAAGADREGIIDYFSKQDEYTFGGLQGPMDYTDGSKPNPCTTRLVMQGGRWVRAEQAAEPPEFDCGPLIDPKTDEINGAEQYATEE